MPPLSQCSPPPPCRPVAPTWALPASVSGHEISESQVNSYLRPDGPDHAALVKLQAMAARENQTVSLPDPRAFRAADPDRQAARGQHPCVRTGAIPSARQLSKVHDELSSSGATIEKSVRLGFRAIGVRTTLIPTYVRSSEYQVVIGRAIGASTTTQLDAYIGKLGGRVRLNPRYGTWDERTLNVDTTASAGLPGFLKLQPATVATGS